MKQNNQEKTGKKGGEELKESKLSLLKKLVKVQELEKMEKQLANFQQLVGEMRSELKVDGEGQLLGLKDQLTSKLREGIYVETTEEEQLQLKEKEEKRLVKQLECLQAGVKPEEKAEADGEISFEATAKKSKS